VCLQAARKLAIAEVTLESFESRLEAAESLVDISLDKLAFHDADTDTDFLATILARMPARMSVSASWNASYILSLRLNGTNPTTDTIYRVHVSPGSAETLITKGGAKKTPNVLRYYCRVK